jgi:phosphoesterase RecJ-like protein
MSRIRESLPAFLREVSASRRILVGTHLNPDGDALGSAMAVSHVLDQLQAPHDVTCHHAAPMNLKFLPGINRVKQEAPKKEYDLGIIVDLEALDRLGSLRTAFEDIPRLIVIDHHVPHEAPGELRIIDTSSPATSAILCDLFFDSNIKITPQIAECLLTGIVTDTGSFRYPNTTPHSLHLAARLLEQGASLPRITEEIYMKRQEAALRIMGEAIHRMKTSHNGRLAWVVLTRDLMASFNASEEHTEGIVNELLSIDTVEIAVVIREGISGRYKASLRSRGGHDVAQVAQSFGGGGHKNAAGLTLEPPADVAEAQIIEALGEIL